MTQAAPTSKTTLFHEFQGKGFYLAQFKTPELAIFSYYLESQGQAYLIDPTYDIYAYQELASKRKVKIISILLTHYHADYVAGHTQLDLPIIMGPNSKKQGSKVKLYQMEDNSTFNLGKVWIKVIHTPGHTLQSTCFELMDENHQQVCLFTGDTIFLGDVGRPDLAVSANITKQDLAKMLFQSLSKIKKTVNHSTRLYPTHGSGSACGKSIGEGNFCTLQTQMQKNYALKIENQQQFIQKILSQMPKPPSYFFHDAKLNQSGQLNVFEEQLKSCSKPLTIDQFKQLIDSGCTIVDSRPQMNGKVIKNSYTMSESGNVANTVGMLIAPDTQLLLVCNKEKATDLIQRLLRIGYYKIRGFNGFTLDQWKQKGLPLWQPKQVKADQLVKTQGITNLDVRNVPQWKKGIIQGSKLISLDNVPNKIEQIKGLNNIYINCRSGFRARVASSILARNGIPSVIVADKFQEIQKAGAKIVEYKEDK